MSYISSKKCKLIDSGSFGCIYNQKLKCKDNINELSEDINFLIN